MKLVLQIKKIIKVALIGLLNKPRPKFVPKESNLANKCYENEYIVYKTGIENKENSRYCKEKFFQISR